MLQHLRDGDFVGGQSSRANGQENTRRHVQWIVVGGVDTISHWETAYSSNNNNNNNYIMLLIMQGSSPRSFYNCSILLIEKKSNMLSLTTANTGACCMELFVYMLRITF